MKRLLLAEKRSGGGTQHHNDLSACLSVCLYAVLLSLPLLPSPPPSPSGFYSPTKVKRQPFCTRPPEGFDLLMSLVSRSSVICNNSNTAWLSPRSRAEGPGRM